jgi:hypothetical protein
MLEEALVAKEVGELRWSVEQRLEFIEFRLFWQGQVNRSDLIETFQVSVNQASGDLTKYSDIAPGNMVYNVRVRSYERAPGFVPRFFKPDANRYLSPLRAVSAGLIAQTESWLSAPPSHDATPVPVRGVDAEILRAVVEAIGRRQALEVRYQSFSRPNLIWRWIAPHALAFDGFRWHARAWCEVDECFKDFVLSRMLGTRAIRAGSVDQATDADWSEFTALEIGPHPELSPPQRAAIALDYGMVDGRLTIRVRKAMLYYTLKRLGLDTDPSARRPQDQQIVLLNQGSVMLKSDTPILGH